MNTGLKPDLELRPQFWSTPQTYCTFLLHQQLQLIFNHFIPLGDVHMQGIVAARLLICCLLPALKRLQ